MTGQRIIDGLQEVLSYEQGQTAGALAEREAVLAWLDGEMSRVQAAIDEANSWREDTSRLREEKRTFVKIHKAIANGEHINAPTANAQTARSPTNSSRP